MTPRLQRTSHADLASWLARHPPQHALFPTAIVQRAPSGEALTATHPDGALRGVLISGPDHGLFEAQGDWLIAEDDDAAEALIDAWTAGAPPPGRALIAHARFADVLDQRASDGWTRSADVVLVARPGDLRAPPLRAGRRAAALNAALLDTWATPAPMRPYLVRSDIVTHGMRFFAVAEDDRICAIAETNIDAGFGASIQQVFTPPALRRRGYASDVVAAATASLHAEGKLATYHADADNAPSIALAKRLGFAPTHGLALLMAPEGTAS